MDNLNSEFSEKLEIIKEYYFRYSFKQKFKVLTDLIPDIKSRDLTLSLINPLYDKIVFYTLSIPDPAYINNKLIADHNRALNDDEILPQFKEIRKWFLLLSDEEKLIALMELILITGGNIIGKLYLHLNKVLKNDEIPEIPENKYDPNVASNQPVKTFNEMLNKYKKQVETASGIKPTKKPQNKKTNKSKSSKTTKSSKKQTPSELDWIQMLPVWTVKHILTSLDDKTLKKLKQVNQYFTFIVNDIKKDHKLTKFLNNKLSQINEHEVLQTPPNIHQLTRIEKRLIKLLERGAALERVHSK